MLSLNPLFQVPRFFRRLPNLPIEYQWEEKRFKEIPLDFYDDPKNLRAYFDELFRIHRFQLPEDFYRLKTSDLSEKGGQEILNYYGGNLVRFI